MLVQTELPWTQLLASGLHLQADCWVVLLARFPGLHGDSLPEVSHSICGQSVDGCQDGRVGVLVGVWQPALLGDAEARGGLRGQSRGVIGGVLEGLVCCSTAVEAVLPLRSTGGVGPGATLTHPVLICDTCARGGGGGVARGATREATITWQGEGGALGGHRGGLPGGVLGRVVVVVGEAGLVGGGVGVAAAG